MAFVNAVPVRASTWSPSVENNFSGIKLSSRKVSVARFTMISSPVVDEFFAKDVRRQYIAKSQGGLGVPSLQCVEATTFDEAWDSRTLKRQSELRYRRLPVAVKIHNMYETRKNALIAAHGCTHEENRVLNNPRMAAAMLLGQAEANRACNRYIESADPAEDMMCRSVENIYMKAVNGSGVFSTACTDGQAKYEAYLNQVRCGSTAFRAKQYSVGQREGAKFAARKMAIARNHICLYEDSLYSKFPRMAGSIRPAFGYYQPFVTSPGQGFSSSTGMDTGTMAVAAVGALAVAGLLFSQFGAGVVA